MNTDIYVVYGLIILFGLVIFYFGFLIFYDKYKQKKIDRAKKVKE